MRQLIVLSMRTIDYLNFLQVLIFAVWGSYANIAKFLHHENKYTVVWEIFIVKIFSRSSPKKNENLTRENCCTCVRDGLPDPRGSLSSSMPSQAIAQANQEVQEATPKEKGKRADITRNTVRLFEQT